jgi:serine/threonine protein kinase
VSTYSDSLLGRTIDDYRLEKPLGQGGMAKVYRALDVRLKRYVAVKVIASDFRSDPEYTQRFEREAQSIARLEHPNIVRIYRFGEADGVHYMAMQYVEGADLATLIRDYKANGEVMPIGDIVRVVQDIGAALDFAHSRDVLHRDVKSSNIMVDQEGRALLTDFGLALLGDVGTRGEVLGSPHYVSPEQVVSSANVVPQSDLYSLGITLFEMLTGELPFTADQVIDLTMKQMSEAPPPPSQFNVTLPPSIDEVVLRALEKDPYDRYPTGAEMSAALKEAVTDWQVGDVAKQGPARRPSLVLLPHKVREQLQAAPLPAIPSALAPTQVAQDEIPTLGMTTEPEARETTQSIPETAQGNRWRGALIFALAVFFVGIIAILALRPPATDTSSAQPTESAPSDAPPTLIAIAATSTTPPTEVSVSTATIEPTPIPPTDVPPTPLLAIPTAIPTTLILPTLPPTTPVQIYSLIVARHRDDSVFVINMSSSPLPLAPLRLGDTGEGAIEGSEWGLETLGSFQCVTAWKDNGNPRMPNVSCTQVGARITREGRDRFWKEAFNIYYGGNLVGACDADACPITIIG